MVEVFFKGNCVNAEAPLSGWNMERKALLLTKEATTTAEINDTNRKWCVETIVWMVKCNSYGEREEEQ